VALVAVEGVVEVALAALLFGALESRVAVGGVEVLPVAAAIVVRTLVLLAVNVAALV
jgi:hypothetical protein